MNRKGLSGISPAVSVNRGVTFTSNCSHHVWWAGEHWRNSGRKEYLLSSSHQTAATPYGEPWGNSGRENRILAPDSYGAYQRNDFSEPRLLYLPIHKKLLNSLTWDILFCLLTIIFWYSDYLPCVAKLHNLASPLTSSEKFSQDYLRCCLPGLKS